MTLDELIEHYRQLLHLPDPTAVLAALATAAANRLPGDPVWTLLVGPPSSGKTEIIDSLQLLPKAVSLSTVTKASLLSGRSGGAGGLLLTHFGDGTGLLLVKDLTTILSEAAGARTEVLATLREVFDGHVARAVGTRDVPLEWGGKIGFLAAVTEEIEQHRAVIGLMGERFVYVPMPNSVDFRSAIAEQAARSGGRQPQMRAALAEAVRDFFATLDPSIVPKIHKPDLAWLCAAADLASRARSPVIRESRNREIELVPEPELPARLVGEFTQLWRGLALIGANEDQARTVIHAALLGGIPKQRRNALGVLLADEGGVRTVQVAVPTRTPEATIRRSLEDLAALGVVDSDQGEREVWRADYWAPTEDTRRLWAALQTARQGP
jgi:hypothetical protein